MCNTCMYSTYDTHMCMCLCTESCGSHLVSSTITPTPYLIHLNQGLWTWNLCFLWSGSLGVQRCPGLYFLQHCRHRSTAPTGFLPRCWIQAQALRVAQQVLLTIEPISPAAQIDSSSNDYNSLSFYFVGLCMLWVHFNIDRGNSQGCRHVLALKDEVKLLIFILYLLAGFFFFLPGWYFKIDF